jgi:hypothetical protein
MSGMTFSRHPGWLGDRILGSKLVRLTERHCAQCEPAFAKPSRSAPEQNSLRRSERLAGRGGGGSNFGPLKNSCRGCANMRDKDFRHTSCRSRAALLMSIRVQGSTRPQGWVKAAERVVGSGFSTICRRERGTRIRRTDFSNDHRNVFHGNLSTLSRAVALPML